MGGGKIIKWSLLVIIMLGINSWNRSAYADGTSLNIVADEARYEFNDREDYLRLKTKKGLTYDLSMWTTDDKILQSLEKLSRDEVSNFQTQRARVLSKLLTVLTHTKLGIGYGVFYKDRILARITSKKKPNLSVIESTIADAERVTNKKSPARLAEDFTQKVLETVDKEIWQSNQVIAHQSEYAFTISASLTGAFGYKEKKGGGNLGFGISFGYNKKDRAYVFEVFGDVEQTERLQAVGPQFYKKIMPFPFIIGLIPRLGVYIYNFSEVHPSEPRKAETLYPAFTSGAIAKGSDDMVGVGYINTMLSVPPYIADSFVQMTSTVRYPLFRLEVSKFLKGFVRLAFLRKGKLFPPFDYTFDAQPNDQPVLAFQKVSNLFDEVVYYDEALHSARPNSSQQNGIGTRGSANSCQAFF